MWRVLTAASQRAVARMTTTMSVRRVHNGRLTPAQKQRFDEDGFLVLDNFVDRPSRQALIREAERIVMESDVRGASIFRTREQVPGVDRPIKSGC